MAVIGQVIAKFQSDVSDFNNGLKQVRSGLENAEDASKKVALGLAGVFTALAGGIGFGVKTAGDLESARQGFVALLGSAEKADATMRRIKKEAAATPFELTGLVAGTQALTAITKDGDKAVDILMDVGKAIATSGKGQADLDRVVLNLQQISSTGKVTAMDIRQFQSAIPMFNDIIEAAGYSIEEIQKAENGGLLLTEAFHKAAQEGGITAQGFEAQAGTFNQVWSNLVDTVTIGASDLVDKLGIFDLVKEGVKGITDVLGKLTAPEGIEKIKDFFNWVTENGEIIAGVLVGILTPALLGLAGGVLAVVAPLIPFAIIGAAIGFLIKLLVDHFGGLDEIIKKIQPALDLLGKVFNELILPALQDLWKNITENLLPALQRLWDAISPILIPLLKILGAIFIGVIIVAIMLVIETINFFVTIITWLVDMVSWMVEKIVGFFKWLYDVLVGNSIIPDLINGIVTFFTNLWNKLVEIVTNIVNFFKEKFEALKDTLIKIWTDIKEKVSAVFTAAWELIKTTAQNIYDGLKGKFEDVLNTVKNVWESIKNAITGPIEDAWNKVKEIADKIKNALKDALNLEQRHSPSVLDIVKRGVNLVNDELAGIGGVVSPIAHNIGGIGSNGSIINISMAGANITSPDIAEEYAELIGDQIMRKLSRGTRS